jgi:hypothetical protein
MGITTAVAREDSPPFSALPLPFLATGKMNR